MYRSLIACMVFGIVVGMGLLNWRGVLPIPRDKLHQESNPATAKLVQSLGASSPTVSPRVKVELEKDGWSMAKIESDGFFDEPDSRWMLRKLIHIHQAAVDQSCESECYVYPTDKSKGCQGAQWFQLHLEPSFQCSFERRIGPRDRHGKWICNPHRITDLAQRRGCLVYSFSDTVDFQFESAVNEKVSELCEIHVFSSKTPQAPAPTFVQHHVRQIGSQVPAIPIRKIVKELGHVGRKIDILHIDCNGCEWRQYPGWFDEDVVVQQFLVRLRWPWDDSRRSFLRTERYAPPAVGALEKRFRDSGFVVTHKEFDTETCAGNCVDMSFVQLSQTFQRLQDLPPTSPYFPLKGLEMPSRPCYQSHSGLGPLTTPTSMSYFLKSVFKLTPLNSFDSTKAGQVSLAESLGFIDEPDISWLRRKEIHKKRLKAQLREAPIHTFDLNPWSSYTDKPMPFFINYHTERIGRPLSKDLSEIVKDLRHSGRTIDIFKIDCEGCEWETYESWFDESVDIRMVLVEVHKSSSVDAIHSFFKFLRSLGYVIYSKEPNTYSCGGSCQEFSFIKLHSDFQ
eukprot:Skav207312  [mRNA]  locus=scaffold2296:235436:237874:- [translate_table: standard]